MPSIFRDVRIRTFSVRDNQYVVYKVELIMKNTQWAVWKRYSDFIELHSQIADLYSLPDLPPKRFFGNLSRELTAERRPVLEKYLRRLLLEHNEDVTNNPYVERFLELKGKIPTNTIENRLESWHDSYEELVNLVSTIRGNLAVRQRLGTQNSPTFNKGDVDLAMDMRKKMQQLNSAVNDLANVLEEAGTGSPDLITEAELLLRQNKLQSLIGEKEELERAEKAFREQKGSTNSRQELLGSTNHRVWGKETPETVDRNNNEILNLQRRTMDEQDSGLDRLQTIIQRQKQIALAINGEL
eukprot:Ihof_evm2s189 gene=Ihof_evmTU2s189